MKERNLVICDDDREYISRLGRYISMKSDMGIRVACFSDRDRCREHVREQEVDVFLIGKTWGDEEFCADRRRRLLLADEREEEEKAPGRAIYRYQAADDILARVLQMMQRPGSGRAGGRTEALFLGIYAPAGWTEGTRLALAVARRLGREGPTVYVGLNEFSPVMRILGKGKGFDLSDVAYCWRRGRLDYEQLERMTDHLDGFDCIPAPVNPAELAELSGVELENLLENLCSVGGYCHILVDFGGSISGKHALFEHCGKNIVLFPDTETGQLQHAEFRDFWESVGAQELLGRTESVLLPLEELRGERKGKAEEYIDELAKRLLRGEGEVEAARGVAVRGGG